MPANHQGTRRDGEVRLRTGNGTAAASANIPSTDELVETSDEGERTPSTGEAAGTTAHEFIDCGELVRQWDVPVSWIRDQVRKRAEDPLPHVSLGKYVRFLWDSPERQAWVERRIVTGTTGVWDGFIKRRSMKRTRHHQGFVFLKGSNLYLRYREDVTRQDGSIEHVHKCRQLANAEGKYRSRRSVEPPAEHIRRPLNDGTSTAEGAMSLNQFVEELYLP